MTRIRPPLRLMLPLAGMALLAAACGAEESPRVAVLLERTAPDEVPVMLNRELPFRYPGPLYEQRMQGNVTLHLFIDRDGRVLAESTRVEETSGHPSFDSAAVTGSQELRFVPARLRGEPMALSVLFPVYFRHPEAAPLPGDTILNRPASDSLGGGGE